MLERFETLRRNVGTSNRYVRRLAKAAVLGVCMVSPIASAGDGAFELKPQAVESDRAHAQALAFTAIQQAAATNCQIAARAGGTVLAPQAGSQWAARQNRAQRTRKRPQRQVSFDKPCTTDKDTASGMTSPNWQDLSRGMAKAALRASERRNASLLERAGLAPR